MPSHDPLPKGWGDDKLTKDIKTAYENRLAFFENKGEMYQKMKSIYELFYKISSYFNERDTTTHAAAELFIRAQAAYLESCERVLAEQLGGVFVSLRQCLECAGYAFFIFNSDKKILEIWESRNRDEAGLKKSRNTFKHAKIVKKIQDKDMDLGNAYRLFYNDAIEFGGHPGPAFTYLNRRVDTSSDSFGQNIFGAEDGHITLATSAVYLSGICSLYIFYHIFPVKFSLLGVKDELIPLKELLKKWLEADLIWPSTQK